MNKNIILLIIFTILSVEATKKLEIDQNLLKRANSQKVVNSPNLNEENDAHVQKVEDVKKFMAEGIQKKMRDAKNKNATLKEDIASGLENQMKMKRSNSLPQEKVNKLLAEDIQAKFAQSQKIPVNNVQNKVNQALITAVNNKKLNI